MATAEQKLPRRSPNVSDDVAATIIRLDLQELPKAEIARQLGVHRTTVDRVLGRTRSLMNVNRDLAADVDRAVSRYLDLIRLGYEAYHAARGAGRNAAPYLAEIRLCQTRLDTLLGLEPIPPDDPVLQLASFKRVVVDLIQSEAPQLAPRLAQRLLTLSAQELTGDQNGH